jgi:hypothetical protein
MCIHEVLFYAKFLWKFLDKNSFCLHCGWNVHLHVEDKSTQTEPIEIMSYIMKDIGIQVSPLVQSRSIQVSEWDDSDVPFYDTDSDTESATEEDKELELHADTIIRNAA